METVPRTNKYGAHPQFSLLSYSSPDMLGTGAAGVSADDPPTLAELLGGEDFLVLGLANDEIGYILPPSDFFLDEAAPYISEGKDTFGRKHYEETNSMGPQTAGYLTEALEKFTAIGQFGEQFPRDQ